MSSVLYFLPFLTLFIWLFLFFFKQKNTLQKLYTRVTIPTVFQYLVFGLYIYPDADYYWLSRLDILNAFASSIMFAELFIIVYYHITERVMQRMYQFLLYIPAILFPIFNMILYSIVGMDRVEKLIAISNRTLVDGNSGIHLGDHASITGNEIENFFLYFTESGRYIATAICFFIITGMCVYSSKRKGYHMWDICRFLFKRKKINSVFLTNSCITLIFVSCTPFVFMGRTYMVNHPTVSIATTLSLTLWFFIISYINYFHPLKVIALDDLVNINLDVIEPTTSSKSEANGISGQLHKVLIEEQGYKDTNMSLTCLADILDMEPKELSMQINEMSGETFNSYIANIRIEAAKQYMLKHRDALLEEVAKESGFTNTSNFCKKFKEATGDTPKIWIVKN